MLSKLRYLFSPSYCLRTLHNYIPATHELAAPGLCPPPQPHHLSPGPVPTCQPGPGLQKLVRQVCQQPLSRHTEKDGGDGGQQALAHVAAKKTEAGLEEMPRGAVHPSPARLPLSKSYRIRDPPTRLPSALQPLTRPRGNEEPTRTPAGPCPWAQPPATGTAVGRGPGASSPHHKAHEAQHARPEARPAGPGGQGGLPGGRSGTHRCVDGQIHQGP